ncbi:MAG TPA: FMN-binding protein [Nitrospirota bacterium]|nr:FMN-binding protein [Nitrospirota bacterium]
MSKHALHFLLLLLGAMIAACAIAPLAKAPVDISRIPDGTYPGTASSWPNKAEVRVTIREGRMTSIELVRHWASWIGRRAEPVIPQRILEKQRADVDAVTGATNSSRVIMHAVHNALEDAVQKRVESP